MSSNFEKDVEKIMAKVLLAAVSENIIEILVDCIFKVAQNSKSYIPVVQAGEDNAYALAHRVRGMIYKELQRANVEKNVDDQ